MKLHWSLKLSLLIGFFLSAAAFQGVAFGQIRLSEIEVDTPSDTVERCEYIEVSGPASSTVPSNTYFLSIDGDSGQFGIITYIADLGGRQFGTNGTITIISDSDTCPGRTFPPATTVVQSTSIAMGFGAETFLIASTTQPMQVFEGQDLDVNNDGVLDPSFGITPIDGIGWAINNTFNRVFGGAPNLFEGVDVPDAATRFPGNNAAFSAAAWYFGELAAPEASTAYSDPRSANFPVGGALTPGGPNVPAGPLVPSKAVVDFDGDGRTDYSVTRNSGGQQTWYNFVSGSNQPIVIQWGLAGDVPVPEDYDGDGKDDIAVWRPGAPTVAAFYILQSSNSTVMTAAFGQSGDDPALTGDWDGDGKADLAVYRNAAAGQQSYFYYRGSQNNPGNNITFLPWGMGGDQGVRGDFDGDSKQDAAIFRPADSNWWVIQSSNSQIFVTPFGLASDVKVSGDFDGDLKTDLAVFRNGVWWVRQSSNSQVRIVNWGAAGDTAVPGDYDGDGSTDLAVWRNGIYYIQPSASANVTYFNWGIPGDTIVASVFNN